jgi:hypothetical protein
LYETVDVGGFIFPCKTFLLLIIIVILYQFGETNMMHFLLSLLRINAFYMFQALLAHPQEAIHKWHLVYCVCVMSIGHFKADF